MKTERTNRKAGTKYAIRPCASGGVNTAKVFSIEIHGVNEREDGIAFVPTIWKSGTTALGSPSVGAGVLCQYNLTGRGKDREVRLVVGKARKTS